MIEITLDQTKYFADIPSIVVTDEQDKGKTLMCLVRLLFQVDWLVPSKLSARHYKTYVPNQEGGGDHRQVLH